MEITINLTSGTALTATVTKDEKDKILAALALGNTAQVTTSTVHAVVFAAQVVSVTWAIA
jgi:hypothetical protein